MKRNPTFTLALPALFCLALAGCEAQKSSNPLSPSVAGPIAGVEISAPKMVEPAQGFKFKENQQPIKLVIENSVTTGVRPVTYSFEVASDEAFNSKVFARSGVTQGDGGRTNVTVEKLDLGRGYYWRVRAEDGANASTFARSSFEVLPKALLNPPSLHEPNNGATTSSKRPELVVGYSDRNAAIGAVQYEFQISTNASFTAIAAAGTRGEDGELTRFVPDGDLVSNTTYFWRARASDGDTTSSWSAGQQFKTPASVSAPGPSPSPGSGGSCASTNGDAIVKCVAAKYPGQLAAGVSEGQRIANMEFLRDRVIEAGICGGLDLAWNLKRGVGPRSVDALAWRHNGVDDVVDIGAAYDDTSRPLTLQWGIVAGPTGYDRYPAPSCK
jgi:hypothetical protein